MGRPARSTALRTRGALVLSLLLFVAPRVASATDFYVDGLTGRDTASGGTAISPWRTIAYAMSNVPTPPANVTHRVLVTGAQDYVVDTTIVLRDRIFLIGVGAMPPRLVPGAQRTLVRVAGTVNAEVYAVDSMGFSGGEVGVDLGSVGSSNAPLQCVIANCQFYGQTQAAVRANYVGGAARLYALRSLFAATKSGIVADVRGRATVDLLVQGCTFDTASSEAVSLRSRDGAVLTTHVDTSRFVSCGGAIHADLASQLPQLVEVERSAFRSSTRPAVACAVSGPAQLEVEECSFLGDVAALSVASSAVAGTSTLSFLRNVVESQGTGFDFLHDTSSTASRWTVVLDGNRIQNCSLNHQVRCLNEGQLDFLATGEVSAGSRGVGMRFELGAGARCRVENSRVVQNAGVGIVASGFGNLRGRFLTIADHAQALAVNTIQVAAAGFDHCVFDNAFQPELARGIGHSVDWTLSRATLYPGIGNVVADPRLARPQYKLTPSSPCIDAGDPAIANPPARDFEGDLRIVQRADLGADEFRIEGSTRSFGTGGFGDRSGMRPRVDILTDHARIGSNVLLGLKDARGRTGVPALAAIVVFGLGEAAPLYDLDLVGGSGSVVFFNSLALPTVIFVSANGTATDTLPIPNVASLVGGIFTAQWLVIAPDANLQGFVTSDALRIQVGR